MRLEQLRLQNFFSHEDTTIDLSKLSLCSIIGANGAGKSSVIEAILWCIFGYAKLANKDLVRSGTAEGRVDLTFQLDGHRYEIARSFGKAMSVLMRVDGQDIAQGNRTQTEELLRRLGIERELLLHSVIVSQGQLSSFVVATPSERRDLVHAMLSLGRFDKAHEVAKKTVETLRTATQVHDQRVASICTQLAQLPTPEDMQVRIRSTKTEVDVAAAEIERLVARQSQLVTQDKVARDRVTRLTADVAQLQTRRIEASARFEKLIKEAETTLQVTDREVALLPSHQQAIAALEAEAAKAEEINQQIRVIQSQRSELDGEINEKSDRYRFLATRAADLCPLCGSQIGTERFQAILAQMKEELETLNQKYSAMVVPKRASDPKVTRQEIEEIRRRASQAELRRDQRGPLVDRLGTLRADRDKALGEFDAGVAQATQELAVVRGQINAEVEVLASQISVARANHKRLSDALEHVVAERTTWETLNRSLEDVTLQATNNRVKLPEAEFVAAALSRTGVPLMIEGYYLPMVATRAQDFLSKMSDGKLQLQLEVLSHRGVELLAGSDHLRPVRALSGGEQTRVALAVRLALSQVLAEMMGVRFDVLLIDEPEFLDPEGVDQFVQAVHRVSTQFPQIFVISHVAELQGAFPNTILVRKVDGVSRVEVR